MTSNDELREHASHLRTIHATILLTCFALLAGVFLTQETVATRALKQLTAIQEVVMNLETLGSSRRWTDTWLEEYLNEKVESFLAQTTSNDEAPHTLSNEWFEAQGTSGIYARLQPPHWSIKSALGPISRNVTPEPRVPRLKPPETLTEFELLWNALDDQIVVVRTKFDDFLEFSLKVMLIDRGLFRAINGLRVLPYQRDSTDEPINAEFRPLSTNELNRVKELASIKCPFAYVVDSTRSRLTTGTEYFICPPTEELFRIGGQAIFNEVFVRGRGFSNLPLGFFEDSFPDLAELARLYQDLPFSTVNDILKGEAERNDERFVLFGTTIPASELSRWGTLAVLALQVYFLLHLAEFNRRLGTVEGRLNYPWIGCYDSIWARVTTIATGIAFPLVVVCLLVIAAPVDDAHRAWLMPLCIALSLILATLSLIKYVRPAMKGGRAKLSI